MKYPIRLDLQTPSNFRAFQAFAAMVGNREKAARIVFQEGLLELGLRDPLAKPEAPWLAEPWTVSAMLDQDQIEEFEAFELELGLDPEEPEADPEPEGGLPALPGELGGTVDWGEIATEVSIDSGVTAAGEIVDGESPPQQ